VEALEQRGRSGGRIGSNLKNYIKEKKKQTYNNSGKRRDLLEKRCLI
jgi:hypothetical protein